MICCFPYDHQELRFSFTVLSLGNLLTYDRLVSFGTSFLLWCSSNTHIDRVNAVQEVQFACSIWLSTRLR